MSSQPLQQELTGSKNIKLKPQIDESLIAGFIVKYGSSEIDLSVKGQLNKISNELVRLLPGQRFHAAFQLPSYGHHAASPHAGNHEMWPCRVYPGGDCGLSGAQLDHADHAEQRSADGHTAARRRPEAAHVAGRTPLTAATRSSRSGVEAAARAAHVCISG